MAGAFRWVAQRAKPYSWRATAAYFWITALASVVGLGGALTGAEDLLFGRTAGGLAAVGFEPANERYLEAVLKVLWVLIIINFRPLGLLGLAAYTLSFPVWVPALLLLNRYFVAYGTEPLGARNIQRGEGRSFPLVAACIALLGGWFLLYGGSFQWQQVLPGIVLSGLLLLALSLRLFLRVRPVRTRTAGTFSWLADGGERFLAQYPAVPTKQYREAGEIKGEMVMLRIIRRWSIRLQR